MFPWAQYFERGSRTLNSTTALTELSPRWFRQAQTSPNSIAISTPTLNNKQSSLLVKTLGASIQKFLLK
jgi:hypothetical protein